jgi:hypothetical protein
VATAAQATDDIALLEVLEQEAAQLPRTEQRTAERPEPAVTIGIVTALAKEFAAMKAALQDCQEVHVPGAGAGRRYVLGRITLPPGRGAPDRARARCGDG